MGFRLLTVAGLAVDAGIHFDLAPIQPPGGPGQLGQPALFYAEAAVALAAGVALLITGRRWAYLAATLIAGTALAAVLVSRYADMGAVGFVPNMYEPTWYPSKVAAAVAEATATITALFGLVVTVMRHRVDRGRRRPAPGQPREFPSDSRPGFTCGSAQLP